MKNLLFIICIILLFIAISVSGVGQVDVGNFRMHCDDKAYSNDADTLFIYRLITCVVYYHPDKFPKASPDSTKTFFVGDK